MRALLYLRLMMFRNGLVSLVTNPKRLAVVVPFLAWMGLCAFALWISHVSARAGTLQRLHPPADLVEVGVLALLTLFTITGIQRGVQGAAFSFTPADFGLLFASPISRRLVVATRVAGDALLTGLWVGVTVLFLAALLPIQVMPAGSTASDVVRLWVAGWLYAILVVNGARVVELILEGGGVAWQRARGIVRVVLWALALGTLGAVGYLLFSRTVSVGVLSDALHRPPWSLLLAPLLTVSAFLTGSGFLLPGGAWGGFGLLGALALAASAAVCYLDRDVVEATLEHSARMSRMRAVARRQDLEGMASEAFRLKAPRERSLVVRWRAPDLALPYLFLAEMLHGSSLRWVGWAALMAAPGVVAKALPLSDRDLRVMTLFAAGYLLLVSASVATMRLRSEITHVALLRTLPVPAWRQLLGLVVPRTLATSIVLLGGLLSLCVARPGAGAGAFVVLALCLPLGVLVALLTAALTAFLFPLGGDFAQRFFGGLTLTFGFSLAITPSVTAVAGGLVLRWSPALTGLAGAVAILPSAALLAWATTAAFNRLQPGED